MNFFGFSSKKKKDTLSVAAVRRELPLFARNTLVEVFDELDSTNRVAKLQASQGAPHGTTIIVPRQTAGRGRLGRTFESPDGGLYMTMILRPVMRIDTASELTGMAGVAVCQAIEELDPSAHPQIKWVNDIFMNGKKVCGILAESVLRSDGGVECIVLGIGVNVYIPQEAFSEEVGKVAASIFAGEEEAVFTRAQLAARIVSKILEGVRSLGKHVYISEYRARCFLMHQQVEYEQNGEILEGKVIDIRDDCSLLIELTDGRQRVLSSGEVSVRLKKQPETEETLDNSVETV